MKSICRWALIGDMVHSRQVEAAPAMRRRIEQALNRVNGTHAADVWAPLMLTKGIDELSGVLESPERVFDVLSLLNAQIFPLRFRVAVGYGEVRNLSPGREAGKMDGSAFHRASLALERARSERLPLAFAGAGAGGQILTAAAEAIAALEAAIQDRWPAAVREIAAAMAPEKEPALTQAAIGRRTQRSQQAVSRAARRGRFRDLERGDAAIRKLLAELSRGVEGRG